MVIDLYLECIQPLQAFRGDELIPSQQPESQDLMYDINDVEDNRESVVVAGCCDEPAGFGDRPDGCGDGPTSIGDRPSCFGDMHAGYSDESAGFGDRPGCFDDIFASFGDGHAGVNEQGDEEFTVENAKRAKSERKNKDLPCGSGSDNDDGSNDLGSWDGSNGEDDKARPNRKFTRRMYHEFNPRHDMQASVFRLGMEFSNVVVFRKAIKTHSVKHRRIVKFKKNDPNMIRNFAGMVEQLRNDTNVDASKCQYYRARSAAREMIQWSVKEQYSKLREYRTKIKMMNPDSSVIIKCSTSSGCANLMFYRLYMCLGAFKKGCKKGCRPILGLDYCFIKGYHVGQLLTVIGVDPNNQMYPVTYALVESECRETWLWFLELLGEDLELNNPRGIVWIIVKQKGLIDGIRELFPHSEH
ncbi:hypothetical protein Ddye_004961 [Dipteronia dyeriana]|uniref:MULE transposase domain-containing protein n=1 Tax=Dipteronia dyeriana TaxID=168575 RepID=A0AAD9XFG8_9ROSI|nr:hypothetical protein Ddye_004961 [Dipteronia dyeriana]